MPGIAVTRHLVERLAAIDADRECAVDLIMYFQRHPRSYLPVDHIALRVGYDATQIQQAIRALVRAGIIVERPGRVPGVAAYGLDAAEWLTMLRSVVSSPRGRRQLRLVLRARARCQHAEATLRSAYRMLESSALVRAAERVRRRERFRLG